MAAMIRSSFNAHQWDERMNKLFSRSGDARGYTDYASHSEVVAA